MSTANNKETIYVDVDDEITNIIDKVQSSDQKIIALVLPKRATVFQSVVNMKLLKRTADTAKKNIVLITSEAGLMPLAGAVGLHVAKNLQSKPTIPKAPVQSVAAIPEITEDEIGDVEPEIDSAKSVGELSGEAEDDAIEVDNTTPVAAVAVKNPKNKKDKKKKVSKIPNFDKFRILLFAGIAAVILLIVGGYWAFFVAPKSTIKISTDSSQINSNVAFTASTTQPFDESKKVVSAERKEIKKTDTQKVPATGKKDVGTKATGAVTLTNCSDSPITVPAGTGVSSGSLTFITQKAVSLDSGNFASNGTCKSSGGHVGTVGVVAQNNGDQYNLGVQEYSVAGFSGVKAMGTAMSGGSSKIITVVSQGDVDNAKQKAGTQNTQAATDELKQALKTDGMLPLNDSFSAGDPVTTTTPEVGADASEVTVTTVTTYSMWGVKEEDVQKLVEADAKKQIDTSKQSILDNGLSNATFVIQDKKSTSQLGVTVQTTVLAGPQLDTEGIKKEVAGKKKGETISIIQTRPGIKDVTVSYSPFWVSKNPTKTTKITIIFDQPKANAKP